MKRKRTDSLTPSQLLNLCVGWDYWGDAFGNDLRAMRDAYRAHRAEVIGFQQSRPPGGRPGTECWAYRVFDLGVDRNQCYGVLGQRATPQEAQAEDAAKIAAWDNLAR